jgi:hypothetical protein
MNMKRDYIRAGMLAGVVIVVALIIRVALLGGAAVADPKPNDIDAGVSESVLSSLSGDMSGDFKLSNIHYFEDKSWVVAEIRPKDVSLAESDLVVLQRQDKAYQVVLGPGSIFPLSTLENIPVSVKDYLVTSGNTLNQ